MNQTFSFAHYWEQADAVSHTVAYLLLIMSLASWFLVLAGGYSTWRIRRTARSLDSFWTASSLESAIASLRQMDTERVFLPLATAASNAATLERSTPSLAAQAATHDLVTRTLRREISRISARLERGQTVLASVGATAPFIGLFGTVWGIYHALVSIASGGAAQIDKLIGPVGEALIMTALGLAVAIPAVIAYNAFNRANRITLAELDGFAYDLHAHLATGTRVASEVA